MAGRTMNNARSPWRARAAALLLIAGALPLSACQQPAADAPLAGAALGGPFTLTDQDGRTVSDRDFAGKYRLIYFGYTYCPDVCPTTLQKLLAGYKAFGEKSAERAGKVQPIFITVDPVRDTPPVMKSYVAAFSPRLIGLTGSEAEVAKVAKEYAVYYKKRKAEGASEYLLDHSSAPLLFGPDGAPIALVPADEGADAVVRTLDQWVK
jgi:protein SCO1/2